MRPIWQLGSFHSNVQFFPPWLFHFRNCNLARAWSSLNHADCFLARTNACCDRAITAKQIYLLLARPMIKIEQVLSGLIALAIASNLAQNKWPRSYFLSGRSIHFLTLRQKLSRFSLPLYHSSCPFNFPLSFFFIFYLGIQLKPPITNFQLLYTCINQLTGRLSLH